MDILYFKDLITEQIFLILERLFQNTKNCTIKACGNEVTKAWSIVKHQSSKCCREVDACKHYRSVSTKIFPALSFFLEFVNGSYFFHFIEPFSNFSNFLCPLARSQEKSTYSLCGWRLAQAAGAPA